MHEGLTTCHAMTSYNTLRSCGRGWEDRKSVPTRVDEGKASTKSDARHTGLEPPVLRSAPAYFTD